jgi:hypothetical protein
MAAAGKGEGEKGGAAGLCVKVHLQIITGLGHHTAIASLSADAWSASPIQSVTLTRIVPMSDTMSQAMGSTTVHPHGPYEVRVTFADGTVETTFASGPLAYRSLSMGLTNWQDNEAFLGSITGIVFLCAGVPVDPW